MLPIFRRAAFFVVPAALIAGTVAAFSGTAQARPASPDVALSQQTQECQSTNSGQPSCNISATIQLPMWASVTAQATQGGGNATVTWSVSCTVNGGSPASSSGSRSGATPFHYQLTLPKSESGNCSVSATTSLSGGSGLTAVLTYAVGEQVMVTVPTDNHNAGAPLAFYLCMRDAKQSHAPGAKAILGSCSSIYTSAWTYNGKTLVHGGLCLTDPHGGWVGTRLLLEKCTGAADQTWAHPGGGLMGAPFVLKSPHLCLDDPKYTKVLNTQLSVYSCNGGPDEQWTLSS